MRISFPSFLVVLAAAAPAQSAQFTTYGTGCTFQQQTLAIGNQGLPRLGQSFGITYAGPNYTYTSAQQIAWPVLVLGVRQAATPIPQFLLQQPPNCFAWTSLDLMLPAQRSPTAPVFVVPMQLPIPNDPGLLGAVLFAQWWTVAQQCGIVRCDLSALPTSDGARMVLGT
jgi:hypothetical protein